jgi:hypothetical protein
MNEKTLVSLTAVASYNNFGHPNSIPTQLYMTYVASWEACIVSSH